MLKSAPPKKCYVYPYKKMLGAPVNYLSKKFYNPECYESLFEADECARYLTIYNNHIKN